MEDWHSAKEELAFSQLFFPLLPEGSSLQERIFMIHSIDIWQTVGAMALLILGMTLAIGFSVLRTRSVHLLFGYLLLSWAVSVVLHTLAFFLNASLNPVTDTVIWALQIVQRCVAMLAFLVHITLPTLRAWWKETTGEEEPTQSPPV